MTLLLKKYKCICNTNTLNTFFSYLYKKEMLKTDIEAIGLVRTSVDNGECFTLSCTGAFQSPFNLRKNLLLLQVSIIGNKGFSNNADRSNPFSAQL